MNRSTSDNEQRNGKRLLLLGLIFLAGCAGANESVNREGFIEIANPALTMSPNAPETIWVPRSYVETGVPRGKELAKKGYDAVTGKAPAAVQQAAPAVANAQAAAAPAPMVPMVPSVPTAPGPGGFADTAGKPAALVPHFGLVVAQDATRVYFNLGREDGVTPGQTLTVYRGGTVVKGLGLAPGETVGTVEIQGFVGSNGSYGVMKQGGSVKINDLVGF